VTFLHELAHLTVLYESGSNHGAEFASNYLILVRGALGDNASTELAGSFTKHDVRFAR
jgi:hypothetical protein